MRALRRWISKDLCGVLFGRVSSHKIVRRKKSNLSTCDRLSDGKVIVVVVIVYTGKLGMAFSDCMFTYTVEVAVSFAREL